MCGFCTLAVSGSVGQKGVKDTGRYGGCMQAERRGGECEQTNGWIKEITTSVLTCFTPFKEKQMPPVSILFTLV